MLRFLVEGDALTGRVVGRRHEIPFALQQRPVRADGLDVAAAVAELQGEAALVDEQRKARLAPVLPLRHQRLGSLLRCGRPDHGLDAETLQAVQRRPAGLAVRAGHDRVRPGLDALPPAGIHAVGRGADAALLDARTRGVLVPAHDAHDLGPILRQFAVDHELHGLARTDADLVGVSRNLHLAALVSVSSPAPVCCSQRRRKTSRSAVSRSVKT